MAAGKSGRSNILRRGRWPLLFGFDRSFHSHRTMPSYLSRVLGEEEEKTCNSDLMLLGFVCLLLTVLERPIANTCIPKGVAESFHPCQNISMSELRDDGSKCQNQDKVSLMSRVGVQQLQMLIFFLAFSHVLSSLLTFSLR